MHRITLLILGLLAVSGCSKDRSVNPIEPLDNIRPQERQAVIEQVAPSHIAKSWDFRWSNWGDSPVTVDRQEPHSIDHIYIDGYATTSILRYGVWDEFTFPPNSKVGVWVTFTFLDSRLVAGNYEFHGITSDQTTTLKTALTTRYGASSVAANDSTATDWTKSTRTRVRLNPATDSKPHPTLRYVDLDNLAALERAIDYNNFPVRVVVPD